MEKVVPVPGSLSNGQRAAELLDDVAARLSTPHGQAALIHALAQIEFNAITLALWLGPLAFLAAFYFYPALTSILSASFARSQAGLLAPFLEAFSSSAQRGILWFTIWQAVASTMLTFAIGLPAAYVLGRYSFPGRSLVRALVIVPFVLPTVVVALAFLAILPSGLERGWARILIAHAFFNVAVVVLVVRTF